MTMYEQARHCSFGLTKTFIFSTPPFLVSPVDDVENILQKANYLPLILAKNEA